MLQSLLMTNDLLASHHSNSENLLCKNVDRLWPRRESYETQISHLLRAVESGELSHAYIEPTFSGGARLSFRADGVVVSGPSFSAEEFSKLLAAIRARFFVTRKNGESEEGIIREGDVFYWVGLMETVRGVSLSLRRRRGTSGAALDWTPQTQAVWQKMQAKPNGLIVFCHRTFSHDNTILRVIDSMAREENGRTRFAMVTESLQNISWRDDVTSLCIDGGKQAWRDALHTLSSHDCDVFGLCGRDENEVVTQAVLTALEDRRALVSVSFPSAVDTLMWLFNDLCGEKSRVDAAQVAQVLLGVIGEYNFLSRNCPSCFEPCQPTDAQKACLNQHGFATSDANFGRSRGCAECFQTGFSNHRLPISEAIFVDEELVELLAQQPSREEIELILQKNGWQSRLQQAIEYSMRGETTLEEALRVGLARRADL